MLRPVSFRLNGKPATVKTDDERMLLWVLRSDLGVTGTKFGCGEGLCGACTVVVGTQAVRSCVTPLKEVAGKQVLTIEGLGGDHLHAIQQAFLDHHAFQCGYCTPGMVMAVRQILADNPDPTEDDVRHGLSGNICRCGSHPRIVSAIEQAAASGKAGS